ncbi:hypothetical protein H0H81_005051 [Sphagnurus paluster]|uniref:Uncharacterized protein n=1 Tax=Sphagnurus paluster TaxID=117069 RepID=A0A9P7K252_9AGAR|nr:hypothetical protein H0H81_005051 [Sphagnurus paluster]
MPLSWDEEMEHISPQGAAELEANLPPVYYNPPPPAKYINPPPQPPLLLPGQRQLLTFHSRWCAQTNQRKNPSLPKDQISNIHARPSSYELVAVFNSTLKESIPAELAKDHPSLTGPLGIVSVANWSASHNVAVWLHEAVTHVTFPGLSSIMISAAQKLDITGPSIPEFKHFAPTCQIETSVPIWNFTTNAPFTPHKLEQALTKIGVFQDINLIQRQPGESPLRIIQPKGVEFHKRFVAKVSFVINNGNGTPYNTIMARSFRFNGQLCHFSKSTGNIKALQCSNCWRISHLPNHCAAKQQVCGDCGLAMLPGKDHDHDKDMPLDTTPNGTLNTTPPPAFARSCPNCRVAKKDPNTLDHHPGSLNCPILREANNKARKVAGASAYRPCHL